MNITVVGIGYVGLANAVLLAQNNKVILLDISKEKVDAVNNKKSPIKDNEIEDYLAHHELDLMATLDKGEAYRNPDFIIIATPTNYDPDKDYFDTSSVEDTIEYISNHAPGSIVVIKSTIPMGFTARISEQYPSMTILFSPEFLREGKALYDNLHPSRIIVGNTNDAAKKFAALLLEGAEKKDIPVLFMRPTEAEAVKLFSNTYLAMRVAYFNELDTYAELHDLDTKSIIEGVCHDPRIGNHYNNPSFGYGGYCLPKDTKQLRANFKGVPEHLISAIVHSNEARKKHIVNMILKRKPKTVGVYRLAMKSGSDNNRESAVHDIINELYKNNIDIIIFDYDVTRKMDNSFFLYMDDFDSFLNNTNLIIANRMDDIPENKRKKIYSRDVFEIN